MTKQKQHKNIRITKEKNMYKIIKNNTFTMASYESKKEAYNAILTRNIRNNTTKLFLMSENKSELI